MLIKKKENVEFLEGRCKLYSLQECFLQETDFMFLVRRWSKKYHAP